ncbi:MAG: DsbA family protein [Caulobacteraceae bacterium]
MEGPHLVYFADPMCSWCWGFAPVIEAAAMAYRAQLRLRLVMGGLRPGTTEPMKEEARAEIRHHWRAVAAASGQAFDCQIIDEPDFVYDTDPAARAVVLARRVDGPAALGFLTALQRAFYAEGRRIGDPEVQADIAAACGFDRPSFREGLREMDLAEETWRDYATSQRAGVTGFPTLIAGPQTDGTFLLVSSGFNTLAPVAARIEAFLAAETQDVSETASA